MSSHFRLRPLTRSIRRACCLGLLAASPAWAQEAAPPAQGDPAKTLDTIVVTAGKLKESVREIAGSVSAVTDQQLQDIGAQSLADYIQRTPGVVFNNYQPGVSHVVMRGIATSSGNVQGQPTTGYFLNEVPLTEPGWTIAIPDIDAFDLNRVEVLRGPQGTLFGSASMGGAVNYVANVADASGFDAAAEATLSQTKNADVGFAAKAMVNVPIKQDLLAVRAVAQYRDDPGFLDNIGTGTRGSNTSTLDGGRLSVVLTPNEGTTLTWLSLLQNSDSDDNSYRIAGLGDLQRRTALPEFTHTKVSVHSLRLDQDLGFADLTALLAYQKKKQDWRFDYTPVRAAYNADLGLDLTAPLYIASGGESTGKSIELRLASKPGGRIDWLVGGMYFDSDKSLHEQLGAEGAAGAFNRSPLYGPGSGAVIAPDGQIFNSFLTDLSGSEAALFGEGSVHFNDQWKLTVGGRLFRNKVRTVSTQVGFSTYPGAPKISTQETKEDGFNPKVSLTWQVTPDVMVYGLVSEGFRFGEPNTAGLSAYPVPSGSKSDSLVNYELGTRTRWAGGRLLVDATLFYVDWKDIQLRLQTPDLFNYASNGGKAYSRGIELSTTWRPVDAFEWQASATWQRARLDEDLFILYYGTAPKGSQLPGSADWTVSNLLTWHFDARFSPTLSLSHQYVGSGISDLNSAVPGITPNRQGNYNLFDLRYRMTFGTTDVTLFGSNLTDKRGITRSVTETNGIGEGLVRPRTVGVTVHWRY
ncbi:TonB-dependent receptor [Stenotrophomonas sp. 24(2023)]|uniref:TonB-dependent receptor n=1 Tax=Stenotrophomonas sp. 24(2023) TaxID=3068324 RepID=UPI0027E1719A|nr:TonB-dependent receptor [Stenotrophomonas sp. 24(2023)]WMJ70615.1 TonB-dependent receptor [Stenotrophomonas sp. 24(2023)]